MNRTSHFICPACRATFNVPTENLETYCETYFLNNPKVSSDSFTATGCPKCGKAVPFSAEVKTEKTGECWAALWEGTTLVFDGDTQIEGARFLFLWDATTRTMDKYQSDAVRPHLQRLSGAELQKAVAMYRSWLENQGEQWKQGVIAEQQRESDQLKQAEEKKRQKRKGIEEQHRKLIERAGRRYPGPPKLEEKQRLRTTVCWYCRDPLNSQSDLKCVGCGWILCECGACGCTYNRLKVSRS